MPWSIPSPALFTWSRPAPGKYLAARLRRSPVGRLLEEAPRLIHEVVKTLVAAVDELTGERHSVLDLLEREER
jgi:hypothetical protein